MAKGKKSQYCSYPTVYIRHSFLVMAISYTSKMSIKFTTGVTVKKLSVTDPKNNLELNSQTNIFSLI